MQLVYIQGKGTENMARKLESHNPKFCVVRDMRSHAAKIGQDI